MIDRTTWQAALDGAYDAIINDFPLARRVADDLMCDYEKVKYLYWFRLELAERIARDTGASVTLR